MNLTRRDFLSTGSKALGLGLAAKAGVGLRLPRPEVRSLAAGQALHTVTFQLGWIANVENMGPYVAQDLGYYTKQGLNVNIIPGGPSTTTEPLVVSGRAFTALDTVDTIARACLQGAPLKVVAVTLQNNPSGVMSLAKKPIRSPKGLVGKRLGIQTTAIAEYNTFLEMNGVNPKSVTYVPVEYDPAPLVDGQVDAFVSFQTSEPIELKLQGVDTFTFLLSQFGYNLWSDAYFVTQSTLNNSAARSNLVHLLRASIKGWQTACKEPDFAAKLVVDKYGKSLGLGLKSQELTAKAFVPLVETPSTKKSGLLNMSEDGIESNLRTMRTEGIKISASELFDRSIIAEALLH
jgi:ABC-type nitrate/sulfonate/bicarbonate transport system substrate-binding protein